MTLPLFAALVGSLLQRAPSQTLAANPYALNSGASQAGAKLFGRECSSCHGSDLSGHRKAPPLNRIDIRTANPAALFWVLRNGSRASGMPSFAHLPPQQRWQIITFLQTR